MDPNEQPPPAATPDAPDQETMEQIRRRRLAKLGGPSGPGTPAAGSPSTETPPAPGQSSSGSADDKTTPKEAEKPTPANTQPKSNISSTPAAAAAAAATPKSANSPSSSRPGSTNSHGFRTKRHASDVDGPSASAPPKKQTAPAAQETIDDYADRILSSIFRFTVDPSRTTSANGQKLAFLPNLSADLSDEGAPLRLSVDRLEEAIMEAATAIPHDRPLFDYLLPCWKRVVKTIKVLRSPTPEKEALLKETRRLCFSNCIFALTVPELFR